jgi:uncharacterized integral membrane protein
VCSITENGYAQGVSSRDPDALHSERVDDPGPTGGTTGAEPATPDPLRGSRTSGFWFAVLALVLVLLLLAVFILQNTQKVQVSFLGWDGSAPLAAALLIATVAGALLVATAGLLRILQLRRRVRRGRRRS